MKVDFHFHLEEGPYSTNWLQRTAHALTNMHQGKEELSGFGALTGVRNSLGWMNELTTMLQKRLAKGSFDIDWISLYMDKGKEQGISHFGMVDHLYRFTEFRPYYDRYITLDDSKLGRLQQHWLDRVCIGSIEPFLAVVREAQERGYPISLGVEADYFPGGLDELGELLSRYELDYVIGSVHFLDGWGFDNPDLVEFYEGADLIAMYGRLFECVKTAAKSGLFDFIAHLDNLKGLNYRPDEQLLLPMYEDVARTLKEADVATELNTGLAYRYPVKEACPSPTFLSVLHKHDVPITMSSDSHFPDDLGMLLDEARELLLKIGYTEVVYFKKRQRMSVKL